jgi:hypothetical protein
MRILLAALLPALQAAAQEPAPPAAPAYVATVNLDDV